MSHSNKWTDKPLSLIDRAFSGNPKGVAPKIFQGAPPPDLRSPRASRSLLRPIPDSRFALVLATVNSWAGSAPETENDFSYMRDTTIFYARVRSLENLRVVLAILCEFDSAPPPPLCEGQNPSFFKKFILFW